MLEQSFLVSLPLLGEEIPPGRCGHSAWALSDSWNRLGSAYELETGLPSHQLALADPKKH